MLWAPPLPAPRTAGPGTTLESILKACQSCSTADGTSQMEMCGQTLLSQLGFCNSL